MNFRRKLLVSKTAFYKRLLGILGVCSVAFIFEACYGVPQNEYDDMLVLSGTVTDDSTGIPVNGLKVRLSLDNVIDFNTQTNEYGKYSISGVHKARNTFTLKVWDEDSLQNGGLYASKDSVLDIYENATYYNQIVTDLKLKRIQ